MKVNVAPAAACPCGSGAWYAQCCEPLHAGAAAGNAERLMRSRYSAYVLRLRDYLLATWHPRTRPDAAALDLDARTRWLGLRVMAHRRGDDPDREEVEFIARHALGGGSAQRVHERSRFERVDGRWYYVDGDFIDARR